MDEPLRSLLAANPELQISSNGKVKCSLSGHEMSYSYAAVQSYVAGAKFQSMKRLRLELEAYSQYFEDRGSNLFCKLTNRIISKSGRDIERHICGSRFQRALAATNGYDKNGNVEMEKPDECRLIDDSDDENEFMAVHESDKSSSILSDGDSPQIASFYPELDDDAEVNSDHDFDAMDTEMDGGVSLKRKSDQGAVDIPLEKKRKR